MSDSKAPVEGKVWGATVGGGAGATVTTFVLWALGVLVWGAPGSANGATDAVAAVPFPVIGLVGLVITIGGIFLGGYLAKHTPRPVATAELAQLESGLASYEEPELDQITELPGVEGVEPEPAEDDLVIATDDGR